MLDPESLEELRAAVRRPCSVASVIVGRVEPDPFRSRLGGVSVSLPTDPWPTHDGRPMIGLAQLNLLEAPSVPACLSEIALVTFFVGEEMHNLTVPNERSNGDGWLIRTHASLDGLVAVSPVYEPDWLRSRDLTWDLVEDAPDWDDLSEMVGPSTLKRLLDDEDALETIGHSRAGTKLGGWPSLIQGEIAWGTPNDRHVSATYCFQIDSEEKVGLNLWDNGVIHVGRAETGGRVEWVAEAQFF